MKSRITKSVIGAMVLMVFILNILFSFSVNKSAMHLSASMSMIKAITEGSAFIHGWYEGF